MVLICALEDEDEVFAFDSMDSFVLFCGTTFFVESVSTRGCARFLTGWHSIAPLESPIHQERAPVWPGRVPLFLGSPGEVALVLKRHRLFPTGKG
jgi:hypothetical protein